jgi:glycine cleavage system H lipoate-binding protein/TusA-related sulfurtransferase
MKIEDCFFPEELLYAPDFNVWFKEIQTNIYKIGITSLFSSYLGKIVRINFKPIHSIIEKGKNVCLIESLNKYEGIRLPFKVKLIEINEKILSKPKIVNDDPYNDGWLALIEAIEKPTILKEVKNEEENIKNLIKTLRIKCLKYVPDYHLYEIGVECAAVIPKLNELFSKIQEKEIVLLVSDDPTAYVEMIRWTDQTKNEFLDAKKEGNLWYIFVRKK